MRHVILPLIAAFACMFCNGIAAVLQKISADKEKNVGSLDAGLLWRLFQDKPYVAGVILDILGWVFTLYAVRSLPLFLVEAIIAANIAVTALTERLFMRKSLHRRSYFAVLVILLGLVVLAAASSPAKAVPLTSQIRWLISLAPIPIGFIGYLLARSKNYYASIGLAAVGGFAFGCTSVVGRIFSFSHPIWHTIYSPLVYAILASGGLGILLFSTALQRAQATIMNASMTASQTVIPAVIGVLYLGDTVHNGNWYTFVLGSILTLGGVISLALFKRPQI